MKTLDQLKSHAYDCLVSIEAWQKELAATNKLISEWREPEKEVPLKEEKPKK